MDPEHLNTTEDTALYSRLKKVMGNMPEGLSVRSMGCGSSLIDRHFCTSGN